MSSDGVRTTECSSTSAPSASRAPSLSPTKSGLGLAEPWNCTNGTVAQLLPSDDESGYVIAILDEASGEYVVDTTLRNVPGGADVNAAATIDGRVVAAVGGRLCVVDVDGSLRCRDEALGEATPDAAAAVGRNYYYASRPGDSSGSGAFYYVDHGVANG